VFLVEFSNVKKLIKYETRDQEIPEQLMEAFLNMSLRSANFTDKAFFW
jgi:hypothetical protein